METSRCGLVPDQLQAVDLHSHEVELDVLLEEEAPWEPAKRRLARDRRFVGADEVALHAPGADQTVQAPECGVGLRHVGILDANLPAFFDEAVVERLLATHTPQFDELEERAPELARVMIPLMQAYPDTVRAVRGANYPSTLPTIDIVAEHSWGETPGENESLRRVHAEFVAAAPEVREALLASGSGHYVMRDRPDVVVDAVARVVGRLREA
jgi:pimeloyl-ACP methyl ester carboxylesterase